MLLLTAIYTQKKNKRWDAIIEDCAHVSICNADDLESARVILKIIAAEEISQMWAGKRCNWEISREVINYDTNY